ncbi:hypothetical protein [Pseudomonas ovata]|uniref:hypothetical protein n=1 Tax=Pseudomonas ovata TaxID=1839709 RepID=UPI000D68F1E9|nr:hypothetical protein [Pseudomonas ovata]
MNKTDFMAFVEKEIDTAAQRIISMGNNSDDVAFGKLTFHLALRRTLLSQRRPQDIGLLGAIDDALKALGVVGKEHSLLSYLDAADDEAPAAT